MTSAQPTRGRPFARQQAAPEAPPQNAPYQPSGWRPQGAPFNLPKSQPKQSYGPPSPSYGPPAAAEPTTVDYEIVTSTDPPAPAKVATSAVNQQKSAPVLKQEGVYFVVLPQSAPVAPLQQTQNLVYAYPEVPKTALVAVPQAPVRAAQLQSAPLTTYKVVYSPITAPYVEVNW
ncbi:predicted GPI-anchored protein 58 [Photinus pyralis]|nr:predicted GPI-anchored protein 58 [Photinus pyralis]